MKTNLMKFISITQQEAEKINRYLTKEPTNEDECLSEDETISHTAKFSDGYQMDIQCCGVQYEEDAKENGSTNTAWTQAVLFDPTGHEVACSDVEDEYLGEWSLEGPNGNKYIVSVGID